MFSNEVNEGQWSYAKRNVQTQVKSVLDFLVPGLLLPDIPFPGGDLMCAFYYYRKACLRKWKNRKGFMATYGKLLDACLRTDNLKCAEKIIMLLGATSMFVYYS